MNEENFSIFPLGDSALTIDFGNRIDPAINEEVIRMSASLSQAAIFGIRDIVPSYSSITIHYDLVKIALRNPGTSAFDTVKQNIRSKLLSKPNTSLRSPLRTAIPVCYAIRFAPDMIEVASYAKTTVTDVIRLHTERIYRIYMIGFLPGFAYMGQVDEQIAMPRKDQPRLEIPAGSVGIAGKQTGIYPLTSPGGWQIIGRTPIHLFDQSRKEPVLLKAGDEVVFYSISENEFNSY